ncbi:hypothetical protein DMH04_32895 [Kibdelosporangium aridum]|uniref:Uncharacterized protein n=1 Tax=Kibdelosporangium aridum TaxID=2030 RepID=A0A428Z1E8_KIBAR|nr:hypothetical protein [Kibdelosporangium aridum]RSM78664.1 hypothetical protein DMH04_32895 [Kibdelosporangium aridum]
MSIDHLASNIAGAALHARTLLANGEPLLWACFAQGLGLDHRGLDGARRAVTSALAKVPGKIVDEFKWNDEVPRGGAPDVPEDIRGYYHRNGQLAGGYINKCGPARCTLWMLTPNRLHVAQRVDPLEEESKGKKGIQYEMQVRPLEPLFDIPRTQIAKLSVGSSGTFSTKYFLQMELLDGSGFEFIFGSHDRAHYERLLALSLGAPE